MACRCWRSSSCWRACRGASVRALITLKPYVCSHCGRAPLHSCPAAELRPGSKQRWGCTAPVSILGAGLTALLTALWYVVAGNVQAALLIEPVIWTWGLLVMPPIVHSMLAALEVRACHVPHAQPTERMS